MSCIILTPKIKELATHFPEEGEESVLNLVGLWQEQHNKSVEEIPSVLTLKRFINKIRKEEENKNSNKVNEEQESDKNPYKAFDTPTVTSLETQQKVDLLFDPTKRRDRVTLIANLFSNEVTTALRETEDALNDRIENSTNEEERIQLLKEKNSLDRFSAIQSLTPSGIFKRVADIFLSYVNDTEEGRIQAELDNINSMEGAEEYSVEEKLEAAKKKAAYKYQEYQKLVGDMEVFKALAEEASTQLVFSEGIKIDPNYISTSELALNEENPEGESETEGAADPYNQETAFKDGWMTNFRQVSSHESLSQAVRKIIRTIPRLDSEGMYEEDDLGFQRYLDADYVHAALMDKLRYMINSDDMLPLLEMLQKQKPWVEQVVDLLKSDDILFSQFYQDFRKDFTNYWVQKKVLNADGSFRMQTIQVNTPEGIYYLLDSWRDNYESSNLLDKQDSVYTKEGKINVEAAVRGEKWVNALINRFNNKSTEERLKLLEDDRIWNSIVKLLNMVGIDANPSILRIALTNVKEVPGVTYTDPVMLLLPQLNIIFKGLQKEEGNTTAEKKGTEKRVDLINTFSSAYSSIASMLAEVTEDAIESSTTETIDGKTKTFYAHTNPNYLGKLLKNLKNVMNDEERFEKFMQTEFKDYDWFYDSENGYWYNDVLRQLEESPNMRKALDHKVVLSSDRIAYNNWDSLDYTLAILTEYWGDPESSKSNTKFGWYYVPILSDSPSAEFIKLRKYTNGDILDENGIERDYDDVILDKLVDLVNQEYNRIMLVRERSAKFRSTEDSGINPIANYDIKYNKKGEITNIGGAEFKFIPTLNDIRYEDGSTFLDKLIELKGSGSGSEIHDFIKDTLNEVMEEGFEQDYKTWESQGLFEETQNGKYKYLPFEGQSKQNRKVAKALISAKEALGSMWNIDMEILLNNISNNKAFNSRAAENTLEEIRDLLSEKAVENEISMAEVQAILRNLDIRNNAKEALREYYYNNTLAISQIIQLATTDLAFYKNLEDFQKRFKEIHAPSLRMNTKAMFNGERIGKDFERTIYIKDDVITSSVIDDIKEILDTKVAEGTLSTKGRDNILALYKEVNVADAQAYRSLDSYRAVLGMSGQWTDAMEQAYNNFKNNKWNQDDFYTIWQTKKPFVYTQINNTSGIEGHSGIKTPVQHKNSEFLLLAAHTIIANSLGKSSKLAAINKFMLDHNIDVVQFESTTKVGGQGIIDLSDVNTEADVIKRLAEATGIGIGTENPNVVHKIPYEDYGIQTATPEHCIDAIQLFGTQIRKLITADMADDAIITVDGKKMTKKEVIDLYNSLITDNIIDSFNGVRDIFKDAKSIEKILLDEVRGNPRYGEDMVRACTLDKDGNFNIPLFDPIQSQRIQTLLNSIIKSRVTKQKIKGGALIQVSNYGLTDDLHIVFEGEGKNKRIKYMECYMPAYSRDFYEALMDPKTHQLDINKLPKNLRKAIGYRVPTEDKYSMVPLMIKGFLPQQNGSAIMLPSEITTLSGSDFDIDKLYVMLPEFKIRKYDMLQARKDYAKDNAAFESILSKFTNSELVQELLNEDPESFKEWFAQNKDRYKLEKPIIEKVKYNSSKQSSENTTEARNNMLIDIMHGILTSPDTASKILNPGGFEDIKRTARILRVLENVSYEELRNIFGNDVWESLQNTPVDILNKLLTDYKKPLNPLSVTTQVKFHQQNMTGGKLIGIYANHNANHALMQHTRLSVNSNGSFMLNGKKLTSLHTVQNDAKEFISKNNAQFLASSVDNVKDPVLADLNQNTFTADASMLLSRLGYNSLEIGMLLTQPIVQEITQTYFRESRNGKSKDAIIKDIIQKYATMAGMSGSILDYSSFKSQEFKLKDLALNKVKNQMLKNNEAGLSEKQILEYYKNQVAVGCLFQQIMNTADTLQDLVSITRADTANGGAGPTIADNIIKILKVDDFYESMQSKFFPLADANVIASNTYLREDGTIDREGILKSQLPYLEAFYSCGIAATNNLFRQYFPQYNDSFNEVINSIKNITKSNRLNVKTMNSVYNDLFAYILSKTEFFGTQLANEDTGKSIVSSRDKRKDFINNFPVYFKHIVNTNEDIASLEFIKRLQVIKANSNTPVDTVVFKNVGRLSEDTRSKFMRDWTSLLYMQNPAAQELALNLFRYSYYRNGLSFGPNTFAHLAPVAVRKAVPDYITTLRNVLNANDDYAQFVNQYIYNHLDNRQLVPEVSQESTFTFTDSQGNILNEVTLEVSERSSSAGMQIVKSKASIAPGVYNYNFMNYICTKINNEYVYYTAIDSSTNTVTYRRIKPLGLRNSFLEYEYGVNAADMESVINTAKDTKESKTEDSTASFDNSSINDVEADRRAAEFDIMQDAIASVFEGNYGTSFDGINSSDKRIDITSMNPDTEFRDADDDTLCVL